MKAKQRKAIYRALVALGAVAVVYGLATQDQVDALAGALLALSNLLASVNVSEDDL